MNEINSDAKVKKLRVYSAPSCPYCVSLKLFLKEHNIDFEEVDISKDEKAAQEIITKTNQMGVPVLEINGQFVIGFDKERISKLLDINDL